MSDRLLTDEEAMRAWNLFASTPKSKIHERDTQLLQAQDTKTDRLSREDERRKMAEWLQENCETEGHHRCGTIRIHCHGCTVLLWENGRQGNAPWA